MQSARCHALYRYRPLELSSEVWIVRYVLLFVLLLLAAMLLSVPEVAVGLYNTALYVDDRTLLMPLYASTPMAAFGLVVFAALNYLLYHRSAKQAFVGGAALLLLAVPATVYAWHFAVPSVPNIRPSFLPQRALNLTEHEHLIAMAVLGFVLFCWNCDSVTRTWRAEKNKPADKDAAKTKK